MIIKDINYKLNDGRQVLIRSPKEEDINAILNYLFISAGETNYLLRYPEECKNISYDSEKEYFNMLNNSDNQTMLVCFVDGEVAGNCQVSWSNTIKTRHRAGIAIALLSKFWGLGLGTRLMEELIKIATENNIMQIELEFVEGNNRARALYEKMGFKIVGLTPDAIRLKDGTFLCEYKMIKEIKCISN